MHSYQHNIKTFNHATRYLTRVQRMFYRELIELYYDIEQPLTAVKSRLYLLVQAASDEDKKAVDFVLSEFFELTGDVYSHDYCDEQIEKYHAQTTAKASAGRASAAARKKKAATRKQQRANGNEQPFNTCSTAVANHEQETSNNKPINNNTAQAPTAGKPASRKTRLPDDFCLTDEMYNNAVTYWAGKDRPDIIADDQLGEFIAHHRAHGKAMADWGAAWKTWYCNAVKFSKPPPAAKKTSLATGDEISRQWLEQRQGRIGHD